MRYAVRFVNHGYSADETFATIGEAIEFAKRTGFNAAIQEVGGNVVAAWDAIGGTKWYQTWIIDEASFTPVGGGR